MKKQLYIILLFLFCLPLYLNCQNQYFPELEKEQSDLEKILSKKYKKLYGKSASQKKYSFLFIFELESKTYSKYEDAFNINFVYVPDSLVNLVQRENMIAHLQPRYYGFKKKGKKIPRQSVILYDDSLNLLSEGYALQLFKIFRKDLHNETLLEFLLKEKAEFVFRISGPLNFYFYMKGATVHAIEVLEQGDNYVCKSVDLKDREILRRIFTF